MENTLEDGRFRVEIKHHSSVAHRYTWEIFADNKIIRVLESPGIFHSWEEASRAGETALSEFIAAEHDA